jgi:hypothetical protein
MKRYHSNMSFLFFLIFLKDVGLTTNLPKLTLFALCSDASDIRTQAEWSGAKGDSRQHLLMQLRHYIPPDSIIPPDRLKCNFYLFFICDKTLIIYIRE